MQSLLSFHVQALMMPKHEHMLEVLLEDESIDVQDEKLLMCVSLLKSSLCVTMGDDKAAMNQFVKRRKSLFPRLSKIIHFSSQHLKQLKSN